MQLQPHQQRVVIERDDLAVKINKIAVFLGGDIYRALPNDEQVRLKRQYDVMCIYVHILGKRIDAFNKPDELERFHNNVENGQADRIGWLEAIVRYNFMACGPRCNKPLDVTSDNGVITVKCTCGNPYVYTRDA